MCIESYVGFAGLTGWMTIAAGFVATGPVGVFIGQPKGGVSRLWLTIRCIECGFCLLICTISFDWLVLSLLLTVVFAQISSRPSAIPCWPLRQISPTLGPV